MKFKILSIIVLIIAATTISSCRSSRLTKEQRTAEKLEKQMIIANEKAVKAYKAHHFSIQPDETQKMMKASKKHARKINRRKRHSFIDRVFRRKNSKNCSGI
ncbi:MAG: hypothetical protein K8R63_05765 [Bacteroidales bacterium]|jgi:uncharacterized protein YcaQ|nr:hypothetical protein [Bacteroidales bacterium]